jgi:tripartite-type tricarboxylate transporter receptor subunit TctC
MNMQYQLRRCLKLICFMSLFSLSLSLTQTVYSATYPNRPIRFIVPYPPGGQADQIARLLAENLTEMSKQAVIVENKYGANGIIGTNFVVNSPADGYTVMILPSGVVAANSMLAKVPYDFGKDLYGVAGLASYPLVLVAHPKTKFTQVSQLIASAKANPDGLNYASGGAGGGAHLAAEAFKIETGTRITHIPYKGTGPAVMDTLSGQVSIMFASLPSVIQYIKAGKLNALAVTTKKRAALLPDVPTLSESGLPNFDISSWVGVVVPSATPEDIKSYLSNAISKIIQMPGFLESLKLEGGTPMPMNDMQFDQFVKQELVRWAKIVKESGAKIE